MVSCDDFASTRYASSVLRRRHVILVRVKFEQLLPDRILISKPALSSQGVRVTRLKNFIPVIQNSMTM